jgi:murein DD-endopeptidase MepM/ murein hydrolase activator NlpD
VKPTAFTFLPAAESISIAWPTQNHHLFEAPEKFFARTRVNPDYGKPGFTRECGKRFHHGCDIAPLSVAATGQTTCVVFTDCATGRDLDSEEPTFIPHDDVFCVFPGHVAEIVDDENASDFGKHVVIEHRWPATGEKFYTLYGHLAEVVPQSSALIAQSSLLGRMGQTSRSADARNWMKIAPHLHFEVRDALGHSYNPVEFLQKFLPR